MAGRALTPIRRATVALGLLAAMGAGVTWLTFAPPSDELPPPSARPTTAIGHAAAAEQQNVYPVTHAEARARLDGIIAVDRARLGPLGGGWLALATLAGDHLARAQLTGNYADYAEAGRLFDRAFAVADAGLGPHLERASYNLSVHRLARVEPDLRRVERTAVPPDIATRSILLGMRGDLAFYRGDHAGALDLYRQARRLFPSVPASLRLATYWAAAGEPDRALAFLTEAESGVPGAQQQVLAALETQRGTIALGRGDWSAAAAHYARADDIFPGHGPIEQQIALTAALRGDIARATALFERVATRDASPEAMDALAGLARARGDATTARHWAARAAAIWAERVRLLPEAAYAHAIDHELAFGDPRRALAFAQANARNRPYAPSQVALAAALVANRRPLDALAVLRPVLDSGHVSAEPHVLAAELYAITGDGAAAEAQRKAALAINPRSFDRNPGLVWLHQ